MKSLGRAAGLVSLATAFSRIFGLIRDQIFAALLGAGLFSDAYVVAFRIPNLLRDLFAEGDLSSAFVPTFSETRFRVSRAAAFDLANLVLGVVLVVVGTLTLIGIIGAPVVVSAIAPGFGNIAGKGELTVLLARIMFPFLPIVAVSALLMGMLNVEESFALPAFAPVMFNIVSIGFGAALWFGGVEPRMAVIGWSIGTLCGGLAQAMIQMPKLYRLGWKFRPSLKGWKTNAGLHQVSKMFFPAVISRAGTQINILVNTILASLLVQGAPSWLNYAFRLIQLPIGVFGVAISVVTLPRVSRDAAASEMGTFSINLASAISLVFVLTVPCTVGLWLLGEPIIRLIYQHGAFGSSDTAATAAAMAIYAAGLPAYAAVKVLAPPFYALKDPSSPMKASLISMALNLAFNLATYRTLGYRGLAMGTAMAALTNFGLLLFWFQRKHIGLPLQTLGLRLIQICLASGGMAAAVWGAFVFLRGDQTSSLGRVTETLGPIAVGILIYFGGLTLLRVPEAALVKEAVRRIYGRVFSR